MRPSFIYPLFVENKAKITFNVTSYGGNSLNREDRVTMISFLFVIFTGREKAKAS